MIADCLSICASAITTAIPRPEYWGHAGSISRSVLPSAVSSRLWKQVSSPDVHVFQPYLTINASSGNFNHLKNRGILFTNPIYEYLAIPAHTSNVLGSRMQARFASLLTSKVFTVNRCVYWRRHRQFWKTTAKNQIKATHMWQFLPWLYFRIWYTLFLRIFSWYRSGSTI